MCDRSIKQLEQLKLYAYDIAGNLVPVEKAVNPDAFEAIQKKRQEEALKYIATIKDVLGPEELERLIRKSEIVEAPAILRG
jgi:hypothetical protein